MKRELEKGWLRCSLCGVQFHPLLHYWKCRKESANGKKKWAYCNMCYKWLEKCPAGCLMVYADRLPDG